MTALVLGTVVVVVVNDRSHVEAPGRASTADGSSSGGINTTLSRDSVPEANVRVLVLNGSGVSQAAAKVANDLRGLGYQIAGTGNAAKQAQTTIGCRRHLADAAPPLAETVGGAKVVAFSSKPPKEADNADCIITLGA